RKPNNALWQAPENGVGCQRASYTSVDQKLELKRRYDASMAPRNVARRPDNSESCSQAGATIPAPARRHVRRENMCRGLQDSSDQRPFGRGLFVHTTC